MCVCVCVCVCVCACVCRSVCACVCLQVLTELSDIRCPLIRYSWRESSCCCCCPPPPPPPAGATTGALPEVGSDGEVAATATRLRSPTMLTPPPPMGTQPPVESSRVITWALTRTRYSALQHDDDDDQGQVCERQRRPGIRKGSHTMDKWFL